MSQMFRQGISGGMMREEAPKFACGIPQRPGGVVLRSYTAKNDRMQPVSGQQPQAG